MNISAALSAPCSTLRHCPGSTRNQPRLVATEIGPEALRFTFRDATNLASRDQGHMDEVLLRFEGPDAFSSQWSYYQGGKPSWMEEIHYRRLAPDAPAPVAERGGHGH